MLDAWACVRVNSLTYVRANSLLIRLALYPRCLELACFHRWSCILFPRRSQRPIRRARSA